MTIKNTYKFKLTLALIFTTVVASTPFASSAPTDDLAGLGGDECATFLLALPYPMPCYSSGIDGGGGGGFTSKPCSGMCMLSIRI